MKRKQLKNYYYILLFLSLFALIIRMFFFVYEKHRDTVLNQQRDQLVTLSTTGANYLHSYLVEKNYEFENIFNITNYGTTTEEINQKMNEKIKLYWSIALTYLDYLKYFPMDELSEDKIVGLTKDSLDAYTKEALKSNELIIGPWIDINSNNNGIYLFKGVFDENGKHGLLVGRIDMKIAFQKTIGLMPVGTDGYFTLGDIDNDHLMKGAIQKKPPAGSILSGYSYIMFGPHNVLVSAKLPYYEIQQPIKITFYFLTGLAFGLFLLFVFLTYTLVKRNTEKVEHKLGLQYQEELYQLNKNATIGIFSREIAHEYNNLLTPLQIYCELLEEELKESEELTEYLGEITESVIQCKALANRLLAFGRNQTSFSSAAPYDSTKILASSIKRLRSLLPDKISLETSVPSSSILLQGEPLELVQIIFNLCINSIHAMEESGGTLTVNYKAEETHATLRIADTGKGMSKETKQMLFSSGFTTKSDGKGNGLGLTIVAKIVEKYDGKITFTSEPDLGTTFTIQFPISQ